MCKTTLEVGIFYSKKQTNQLQKSSCITWQGRQARGMPKNPTHVHITESPTHIRLCLNRAIGELWVHFRLDSHPSPLPDCAFELKTSKEEEEETHQMENWPKKFNQIPYCSNSDLRRIFFCENAQNLLFYCTS